MSSVETGRGNAVSLFSCARARRVKSCRGAHTHTLWPWAPSHIHTMRLSCLGLGPGPRALGSHTLNQYFISAWDSDSVAVTVLRVAGRSAAPSSSSFSTSSYLKYEDPWRYLILCIRWMICRIMVLLQFVSWQKNSLFLKDTLIYMESKTFIWLQASFSSVNVTFYLGNVFFCSERFLYFCLICVFSFLFLCCGAQLLFVSAESILNFRFFSFTSFSALKIVLVRFLFF